MSALVEKVARAIAESEFGNGCPVGNDDFRLALVALKAIRDYSVEPHHENDRPAAELLSALVRFEIDAAIQEHSTTPPRNAS